MEHKLCLGLILIFFAFACNKDKVNNQISQNNCVEGDSVSFNQVIAPVLSNNCLPCHQSPGSGGINLDNYNDIKNQALSGQLVQSIIHDTNYIIMPPPPLKELDSCDIKRIKLWILQGCHFN